MERVKDVHKDQRLCDIVSIERVEIRIRVDSRMLASVVLIGVKSDMRRVCEDEKSLSRFRVPKMPAARCN